MTAYFDDDLLGGQRDSNAIQKAIAQATGQGFGDPDPAFQQLVITALLRRGLDVAAIAPSKVTALVKRLWDNPTMQDEWSAEQNLDPSDPNFITAGQFVKQVDEALFSPSNSPDPALAQTGIGLLSAQHKNLTSEEQSFVLTGGVGNSSDVRQIIISVAEQNGVDPALALAVAYTESGLDPTRVGDYGHSVGLFQLHDEGMGYGMGNSRYDPRTNAEKGISSLAATIAAHPDIKDPIVLAVLSQRPALTIAGQNIGWTDDPAVIQQTDAYARYANNYGPIKAGKLPSTDFSPSFAVDQISAQYPGVASEFESMFKRKPSFAEMSRLIGLDDKQLKDALRSMPSHIPGLNMGQYTDLRTLADDAMQKVLGHLATDGIVVQLHNDGHTTPREVEHYINHLSETALGQMGATTYNAIYSANRPAMSGIYGEQGFDPRIAQQQHSQAQQDGSTDTPATDAAATADRLPLPGLESDPNQNQQPFAPGVADTPPPSSFQQGEGRDSDGSLVA